MIEKTLRNRKRGAHYSKVQWGSAMVVAFVDITPINRAPVLDCRQIAIRDQLENAATRYFHSSWAGDGNKERRIS